MRSSFEQLSSDLEEVQEERDVAIATLNKHGLTSDSHVTDHMTQLQGQNRELQNIVKQMREDMEQLTNREVAMPTTGYVEYMESEVVRLKTENRELVEKLKSQGKPPPPSPPPSSGGKKQHQNHLIALSDTIAGLQREKMALELTTTRLKSRIEELEREITDEREKVS